MKAPKLRTEKENINLVEPNIERDAQKGVEWLSGELGKQTLQSMGVPEDGIQPTTLNEEIERVKDFIEKPDQLNWMIAVNGEVVGSVWADLTPTEHLQAPSVHIMIGEPSARGEGTGAASVKSVIHYLLSQGYSEVYSRHLTSNKGASKLLSELGFVGDGSEYTDRDSLEWQNVKLP